MKNAWFLFIFSMIWLGTPLQGQDRPGGRNRQQPGMERVKAAKEGWLSQRMDLSAAESEKFWPLFREYEKQQEKLKEKYRPNRDLITMDDAALDKHMEGMLDMEGELLQLKRQYYGQFRQMLGTRKVAVLMRGDREFNLELLRKMRENRENGPSPRRD